MDKKPRQVKQRYYYIFWTFATIAVVIGQIHVAYSYNNLADALRESLLWINLNCSIWPLKAVQSTLMILRVVPVLFTASWRVQRVIVSFLALRRKLQITSIKFQHNFLNPYYNAYLVATPPLGCSKISCVETITRPRGVPQTSRGKAFGEIWSGLLLKC